MSKPNKKSPLCTPMTIIDGVAYRVEPYPSLAEWREYGLDCFKKAVAYQIDSDLTHLVLPYRGFINDVDQFSFKEAEPGIWTYKKNKKLYHRIVRPHGKKELEKYSSDRVLDIMVAVKNGQIPSDQFMDLRIGGADIGSDIYSPPLHIDDDALNLLIKTAIRLKSAPFEPYGKRMEAMVTKKYHGNEGINARNNFRRAMQLNRSMSPSKALQYSDVYQLELAYIIKDQDGAMHPMFDDGEMMIIYPNGHEFPIDPTKLISASEYIDAGITETQQIEKERNKEADLSEKGD